jgi:hypothetical protein
VTEAAARLYLVAEAPEPEDVLPNGVPAEPERLSEAFARNVVAAGSAELCGDAGQRCVRSEEHRPDRSVGRR